MIDPAAAKLLADAAAADPRGIDALTLEEARRRGGSAPVAALVPFEDVAEARDRNAGGVRARLYRPSAGTLPLLIYFHGGGWVVGSVANSDNFCRALANRGRCAVLSVDYRLAPEHRYPAAADDARRATEWAAAHATDLGIDASRIAVGGSSAGGNLAAVVALRARGRGPALRAQLLHVPVLDHDFTTGSYRTYATGHGLTLAAMRWFWRQYLPDERRRDEPDASPLRAKDLAGLPPALLVAAECDPLRDEGRAYAARLRDAGVTVRALEYPGMVHGFMSWASALPAGRRAFDEVGAALRTLLA